MNLKTLVGTVALVTILLFRPAAAAFYGPYTLIAPTVLDGDTLRADVAVWPNITASVLIRVIGVDTPELTPPPKCAAGMPVTECDKLKSIAACELDLAKRARDFTDAWVKSNSPLMIGAVKADKFSGRVDAVVTGDDGKSLTKALIDSGHGRAYDGKARRTWCDTAPIVAK